MISFGALINGRTWFRAGDRLCQQRKKDHKMESLANVPMLGATILGFFYGKSAREFQVSSSAVQAIDESSPTYMHIKQR